MTETPADLEGKVESGWLPVCLFQKTWKKSRGASVAILFCGAGLLVPVFYGAFKSLCSETKQVEERYHQLLAKYADRDNDGYISEEEKEAFNKVLFNEKRVKTLERASTYFNTNGTSQPGRFTDQYGCPVDGDVPVFRYSSDGKEVPREKLLEWMNAYFESYF